MKNVHVMDFFSRVIMKERFIASTPKFKIALDVTLYSTKVLWAGLTSGWTVPSSVTVEQMGGKDSQEFMAITPAVLTFNPLGSWQLPSFDRDSCRYRKRSRQNCLKWMVSGEDAQCLFMSRYAANLKWQLTPYKPSNRGVLHWKWSDSRGNTRC